MRYLQTAIEMAPDQAYSWYELGACQKELGLLNAASVNFERCLDIDSSCREAAEALQSLNRISFGGWVGGILRRWRGR